MRPAEAADARDGALAGMVEVRARQEQPRQPQAEGARPARFGGDEDGAPDDDLLRRFAEEPLPRNGRVAGARSRRTPNKRQQRRRPTPRPTTSRPTTATAPEPTPYPTWEATRPPTLDATRFPTLYPTLYPTAGMVARAEPRDGGQDAAWGARFQTDDDDDDDGRGGRFRHAGGKAGKAGKR
jgi:hypothetical protein